MFTNNFLALQHNLFWGVNGKTGDENGIALKALVNHAGEEYSLGYTVNMPGELGGIGYAMMYPRCRAAATGYPGVYFGTGSTPATKEDYCLEATITSGLTLSLGAVGSSKESEGQYIASGSYLVRNDTEAEINIWEIGCFGSAQLYKVTGNSYITLLERTVLTEPITIAPGQAKLVTYKVTFNQTLNVE